MTILDPPLGAIHNGRVSSDRLFDKLRLIYAHNHSPLSSDDISDFLEVKACFEAMAWFIEQVKDEDFRR